MSLSRRSFAHSLAVALISLDTTRHAHMAAIHVYEAQYTKKLTQKSKEWHEAMARYDPTTGKVGASFTLCERDRYRQRHQRDPDDDDVRMCLQLRVVDDKGYTIADRFMGINTDLQGHEFKTESALIRIFDRVCDDACREISSSGNS